MERPEVETFSSMPWYRKVAFVLLLPIVIPLCVVVLALAIPFFAATLILGIIGTLFSDAAIRRRMRRAGRFLSWRDAQALFDSQGGTLIIESPSLGWGNTLSWWTPDRVADIAPCPYPTEAEYRSAAEKMRCTDWDRWCYENYVSHDRGKAALLRKKFGKRRLREMLAQFPKLQVVETWSALIHFPTVLDIDEISEPDLFSENGTASVTS